MVEHRSERHRIAMGRAFARAVALLAIVALLVVASAGGGHAILAIAVVASSAFGLLALARLRQRRASGDQRSHDRDAESARFFSVRADAPEGLLVLDARGRIESADLGACSLFAAAEPQLLDHSVLELIPTPPGAQPSDHLAALLGSHSAVSGFGRVSSHAWDARAIDGRTFLVEVGMARIDRAHDGGPGWHYEATLHAVVAPPEPFAFDLDLAPAIDLREPLGDDRVVLRYRPMFDLVTGQVASVEAQGRLLCDDGTLLAPSEFVALWERTGLLGRLGEIVLPQALRDLASLRGERGSEQLRVAVDVAPEELTPALGDLVAASLARHELPASSLQIEITEQAPLDAMPAAVAQLRSLHALGVGVLLDDFGSGFTRLDLIHDLPVDAVKIDPGFVQRMGDSTMDRDVVETIIGVAQRRDLAVLADGVASVEQAHALVRLGCQQVQGPLFGPPVDVDELRYLLREWRAVPAIATAMIKNR